MPLLSRETAPTSLTFQASVSPSLRGGGGLAGLWALWGVREALRGSQERADVGGRGGQLARRPPHPSELSSGEPRALLTDFEKLSQFSSLKPQRANWQLSCQCASAPQRPNRKASSGPATSTRGAGGRRSRRSHRENEKPGFALRSDRRCDRHQVQPREGPQFC